MGGDGGVIASNRRYMRGAGSASCTADAARQNGNNVDPTVAEEEQKRSMLVCALTDQPLKFNADPLSSSATIVACPYGKLYNKEAAVEALLKRKQESENNRNGLGSHIRGLKDLYDVRFQVTENGVGELVPVCPVTGRELNGKVIAYALVPEGKTAAEERKTTINVVSEKSFALMGEASILEEYGPTTNIEKILLAPSTESLKEIKNLLEEKRTREKLSKKKKSVSAKKAKRKREETGKKENANDDGKKTKS